MGSLVRVSSTLSLAFRVDLRRPSVSPRQRFLGSHGVSTRCQAETDAEARSGRVAGMGIAGIDYLAIVSAYPHPDQKIRTESFEVRGGGNCGNALTGAAKLGLSSIILTKVGDDSTGSQTLNQLNSEGVDTSRVVVAENSPSGFTYIIVDRSGGTRTCIHTPMDPLTPSELSPDTVEQFLKGADIVYFDGRLTEAAIVVARKARQLDIQVLVEAEGLRPSLENLIELADTVVMSKNFPQDFSGEPFLGDALLAFLNRFQNAKTIITTLGDMGSVALTVTKPGEETESMPLEDRLSSCWEELQSQKRKPAELACISKNGTKIHYGIAVTTDVFRPVLKRADSRGREIQTTAREDAKQAAVAAAKTLTESACKIEHAPSFKSSVSLTVATAASISEKSIVDTTGAGDAFIAAVLYGIVHGDSVHEILRFAGAVAACKCTEIGARSGQPKRSDMVPLDVRPEHC